MIEIGRYKWNEARYDPTTETFSDFLKNIKTIAKQAFGADADQCLPMFLLGKLPVAIQQELTMAKKKDSAPEEIKFNLQRKYQYQQILTPANAVTVQPFNQMPAPTYRQKTSAHHQQPKTPQHTQHPQARKFEVIDSTVHTRKQDCRSRQREEANETINPDAI